MKGKGTYITLVIVIIALLGLHLTAFASGKPKDDWKLRVYTSPGHYDYSNIYIKEYRPERNVTCYVAVANNHSDAKPPDNLAISCIN